MVVSNGTRNMVDAILFICVCEVVNDVSSIFFRGGLLLSKFSHGVA